MIPATCKGCGIFARLWRCAGAHPDAGTGLPHAKSRRTASGPASVLFAAPVRAEKKRFLPEELKRRITKSPREFASGLYRLRDT